MLQYLGLELPNRIQYSLIHIRILPAAISVFFFYQVIKTCDKMRELGFTSIRMLEVRKRPYDAR